MSFVKDTEIFDATNGGLDIIIAYYPNAQKVITKTARQFKIRESEKTASASLKQLANGIWVVTDFGGDQKSRNGIQVCALEENISYGEACALLGARFQIEGAKLQLVMPIIDKRPLQPDEVVGQYKFEYNKDFTNAELALLGPRVNGVHCKEYKLKSCKSFTYCKENEAVVTIATDEYPIFVFDFDDWQKIYQPNSFEKKYRFRYAGKKPSRHVFGLEAVENEFKRVKLTQQGEQLERNEIYLGHEEEYEDDHDEDEEKKDKKKKEFTDPRLEKVFIVSGGSDGLNLRSFGHYAIWFNSESEHLEWDEYRKLKAWAKHIYYIADLDHTGVKQAIQNGLKYLDLRLLWLPEKLKEYKDRRGNPRKDFKDYVDVFYKNDEQTLTFQRGFDKLVENALPMQFYTIMGKKDSPKKVYGLSNTRLYHFLNLMGFGRYESEMTKDGYIYVRKEGNIIRIVRPDEIENFVHAFLEERGMHPDLRDFVYNSPKLSEKSLAKLPRMHIDFTSADKQTQYIFFKKKVWKVTADDITEYRQGEVDRYVWENKIIDFDVKKADKPPFEITTDRDGNLDIIINQKDNWFLNYLINGSRMHWRKEIEEQFENRPAKDADEYFKANQFNIAGDYLSEDEKLEQKLHLINKLYSFGYMLHKYKDDSKAWCVFAMDNKMSEVGESHGGSGKSLGYGIGLNHLMKRRFYLKGRDSRLTQNDFIYHGVTEDTDYIFIDDATQYLQFDFFFSEITGSLKVNPKNAMPFEIPFPKAPKFAITSNFTMLNFDPSTARRLLLVVFSDWYHYNSNDEYKEARQVSDDFGGKNLFRDFDDYQWNAFYNLLASTLQFFLRWPTKINPPMDNVTRRSLMAEMGDAFLGWATGFFATEGEGGTLVNLDADVSKETAFEDFQKTTKLMKWTPTKFKKALKAFCQWNGWVLNPKEMHNNGARIIKNIGGKTQEVIYIDTNLENDISKVKKNAIESIGDDDPIFGNKHDDNTDDQPLAIDRE